MNLYDIPLDIVKEYLYIRKEKERIVKKQDFDSAAKLRQAEKEIIKEYSILLNYSSHELEIYYLGLLKQERRNRNIDKLLK